MPKPKPSSKRPTGLPKEAIRATELGEFSGYVWWLPECADSTAEMEWSVVPYHWKSDKRPRNGWVIPVQFPAPGAPAPVLLKPSIVLNTSAGEFVRGVLAEECMGPGWGNRLVWVLVEDGGHSLRVVGLQPEEQTPVMAHLHHLKTWLDTCYMAEAEKLVKRVRTDAH